MVEAYVRGAFEAARGLPSPISEVPFIGGAYCPRAKRAAHADLKRQVRAALCAHALHDLSAPHWAQHLPLREHECIELKRDADNKLKLVGYFGLSLRRCDWDERHPLFAEFCTSLLYSPAVPECLEHDDELQNMFPSLPLPHLDDDLCWQADARCWK
jgi:hypothetical protein